MSAPTPARPPRLWRPAVAGAIVYVALFTLGVLWMMGSLDGPQFADFVLKKRVFRLTLIHLLSIANGVYLVILLLDVGAARRSQSDHNKAQFLGLVLAITMMAVVQAATFSMLNAAEAQAAP